MKRSAQHPVFEKSQTNEERVDWSEAHHWAKLLVVSAKMSLDYLEGNSGDPTHAFEAQKYALRMASSVDRAIARRQTRMKLKESKSK